MQKTARKVRGWKLFLLRTVQQAFLKKKRRRNIGSSMGLEAHKPQHSNLVPSWAWCMKTVSWKTTTNHIFTLLIDSVIKMHTRIINEIKWKNHFTCFEVQSLKCTQQPKSLGKGWGKHTLKTLKDEGTLHPKITLKTRISSAVLWTVKGDRGL